MSSESKESSTRYPVPALEKGLDILEALAAAPNAQSLVDLARTLGRSSSELFRMLNYLEQRRYVYREEGSGTYQLTLKLYAIAHTQSLTEKLLQAAKLPMAQLAQTVRESCHLSMLSHGKLVVLAQAQSPSNVWLSVEVGREFSMIGTASGRLLLAYLADEEAAPLLAQDDEYGALDETEEQLFLEELEELRRTGYAITADESRIGVTDISVLVGNPTVGLSAALAIPALAVAGKPPRTMELLERLQKCAAEITSRLGI